MSVHYFKGKLVRLLLPISRHADNGSYECTHYKAAMVIELPQEKNSNE